MNKSSIWVSDSVIDHLKFEPAEELTIAKYPFGITFHTWFCINRDVFMMPLGAPSTFLGHSKG